jgi:flagellin-like protein
MKILKSKKALSPVVASIILIAVTVAVSIAVAAWMGALTVGFMGTEQVIFTSSAWGSPSGTTIPSFLFKVKNTGSADLSFAEIRVDDVAVTTHNVTLPYSLTKGTDVAINITKTFTRGAAYRFSVTTSKGNTFGPYTATAP